MFDGFSEAAIDGGETTIFARWSGAGPPVLFVHGFPETHVMWHAIAPRLVDAFTVVCADLRGYGASGTPPSTEDHAPYAKRAMARDLLQLMIALGHGRFAIVGHDRGGRAAYRLALDHPAAVTKLVLFDVVPTTEAFHRADARLALAFWPWSLLAQPAPLPERLIAADPEAVVLDAITQWGTDASTFSAEVRAQYVDALRDREHVHAICEEYRAAATLDVAHDDVDRQHGRRITCPLLVQWAAGSALDTWYTDAGGPLGLWRQWADDVRGHAVPGGHFFPEQFPAETADALRAFLRSS